MDTSYLSVEKTLLTSNAEKFWTSGIGSPDRACKNAVVVMGWVKMLIGNSNTHNTENRPRYDLTSQFVFQVWQFCSETFALLNRSERPTGQVTRLSCVE